MVKLVSFSDVVVSVNERSRSQTVIRPASQFSWSPFIKMKLQLGGDVWFIAIRPKSVNLAAQNRPGCNRQEFAGAYIDTVGKANRRRVEPRGRPERREVWDETKVVPTGVCPSKLDVHTFKILVDVPSVNTGADVQTFVKLVSKHPWRHPLAHEATLHIDPGNNDSVDAVLLEIVWCEWLVHRTVQPPSTTSWVPVMKAASSESRNETAHAMSSGSPRRGIRSRDKKDSDTSRVSGSTPGMKPVNTGPGATALTLIWCRESS